MLTLPTYKIFSDSLTFTQDCVAILCHPATFCIKLHLLCVLGFYQRYLEEPYGIIAAVISCLCCWLGFANIMPRLIINVWWAASVPSRALAILVALLGEHSNLSSLRQAIRNSHTVLDVHRNMQKWMQTLFFPIVLSKYSKAIKSAYCSANLFSNPILLLVTGICGHFLGL